MNLLRTFLPTRWNKSIQSKTAERNRKALESLEEAGFERDVIRPALLKLNRVNMRRLVDGYPITMGTAYNTIRGRRTNRTAQELIAGRLGLEIEELWPEKESRR